MKKECTVEEARLKAEAYCAMSEHCTDDVCRKLEQWGVPLAEFDSILEHLKKEKYVDDRRYAIAFVRDKYRFNQWGRIKIAQSLRMKQIGSEEIIQKQIIQQAEIAIETADVIMFVHREEYYDKENPEFKNKAKIIIAKQRNGPVGDVDLLYFGATTKFKNKMKPVIEG